LYGRLIGISVVSPIIFDDPISLINEAFLEDQYETMKICAMGPTYLR
jgi:hypothetical protein